MCSNADLALPSISCLNSWAQWEHIGLIPVEGSCKEGALVKGCDSPVPLLEQWLLLGEDRTQVWLHTFQQ